MRTNLVLAKLRCNGRWFLLVQIGNQLITTTPTRELNASAVFLSDLLGLPVVLVGLNSSGRPEAFGPRSLLRCVPLERLSDIQWTKFPVNL